MQIFSSQIVRYGDENDQQERIGLFEVRVPDYYSFFGQMNMGESKIILGGKKKKP